MSLDPSTLAAHAGSSLAQGAPSAPAIHLAAYYVSAGDPTQLEYAYGRHGNPTWEALESALGELEGARALLFSSGQAAALALMLVLTEQRPRVVLPHDGYYGSRKLAQMLQTRGVEPSIVDMGDLGAVERALTGRPSVLWAETPTNPFLRVLDLRRLSALARAAGSPMVVDNTTATPALQLPLDMGADATITSLTKSASGHADVLLGSVATRGDELFERLRNWRSNGGMIPGPFEAWAALRGLKTLPLRIARSSENALALARHLAAHAKVERVHYPSLDPATREVALQQMQHGFGPLLSFEIRGGAYDADRVVGAARLVKPGTSFGGVESSWERRARWASESAPENLIRMSVGIEAPADLIADVDRALASLG